MADLLMYYENKDSKLPMNGEVIPGKKCGCIKKVCHMINEMFRPHGGLYQLEDSAHKHTVKSDTAVTKTNFTVHWQGLSLL
jgi:hypothetical protein